MSFRVKVKRDANERAIVEALRAAGYAVQTLEQGKGCPDLLVCNPDIGLGRHYLLEVKQPGEKLTAAQVRWHAAWPGKVYVVHTADEALEAVR